MIVGPVGASILCCEDSFADFRKEIGLRNPLKVRLDNYRLVDTKVIIKGKEVKGQKLEQVENPVRLEPGEKERYDEIRNKFFAAWILVNCGYDILQRTEYIKYMDGLRPCQGLDRQCSLWCECYSNKCSIGRFAEENPQIWRFIINECEADA